MVAWTGCVPRSGPSATATYADLIMLAQAFISYLAASFGLMPGSALAVVSAHTLAFERLKQ